MSYQNSQTIFDKYGQVVKRRWVSASGVFFFVSLLGVMATSLKRPLYSAEGLLRFQKTSPATSLTGLKPEIGTLESVETSNGNPLSTEAEVIRSLPVVSRTIEKLELTGDEGDRLDYRSFLENLKVQDIQKTDLIKITYQHKDAEVAAKVVNTLIDIYLQHHIATNRTQVTAVRNFIERQLPSAKLMLRKKEAELAKFRKKHGIVSLEQESARAVEDISNIQAKTNEVKSQIANVAAQIGDIRNRLGMNLKQSVAMTAVSQSDGVQNVLKEVQQLESQIATARITFQDNHPRIIKLENKLEVLKGLLQQRVENISVARGNVDAPDVRKPVVNNNLQFGELQQQLTGRLIELESTRLGLVSELAVLNNSEKSYKKRIENLPALEQMQHQLKRELETAQQTYKLLTQKLEESRIAENQNLGNASLVSKALAPQEPISSTPVSYLGAGLVGLLASIAFMYLSELKDKSVKTVEEAQQLTGLTLIGLIPSFPKTQKSLRNTQDSELPSSRLVVRDMPRSSISEAYKMLRANLKFMNADKESKVIVVTSSVPKEGKSTVAANLATSMAQMESKVLLIDADLHRPIQHNMWEISNAQGLSNVIVGDIEIMRAIQKVEEGLDILTSGVVPPSPASLLDSKRMASLIDSFASYYDYVIIDAPSLNIAADAATLGQMADGVLLVVRPGVVDSVNAILAKEILEKSGQNVLGQVVNGVIPENESHSYYYFEQEYDSQDNSAIRTLMNNLNHFV